MKSDEKRERRHLLKTYFRSVCEGLSAFLKKHHCVQESLDHKAMSGDVAKFHFAGHLPIYLRLQLNLHKYKEGEYENVVVTLSWKKGSQIMKMAQWTGEQPVGSLIRIMRTVLKTWANMMTTVPLYRLPSEQNKYDYLPVKYGGSDHGIPLDSI